MKLNNSIKLAIANFSLFWKLFVYKAVAVGITILLVIPLWGRIYNAFEVAGFWDALSGLFDGGMRGISFLMKDLSLCIKSLFEATSTFASQGFWGVLYVFLVLFFVFPFLMHLGDVAVSESIYVRMTSLAKSSFVVNFIDKLKFSCGYSALYTLISIPFWAIIFAFSYGILGLYEAGTVLQILTPILLFVFVVLMLDIKATIFSGWVPSIVVFNVCAGRGLKKGIRAVRRNYLSVLSSFAVVLVCIVSLGFLFGLYSAIVFIPLYSLIVAVFGQVLFFESQGMNYYISPEQIVTPRKLEQADSIEKVKFKI